MQRRDFLRHASQASQGVALGWLALPGTRAAWAAPAPQAKPGKRLVVVLLRGAIDGLHVVVPYSEPAYAQARPTLALARPGSEGGVLDLDGHFGLHPALSSLMPLWQAGRLGFVHASGSPQPTRSHFEAQDDIESGTPGRARGADGWLNRLLGLLPAATARDTAARAVGVGPTLPRILAGPQAVATLPSGAAAGKPSVLDKPHVADAFAQLYAGDDALSRAFRQSQASRRELMASMDAAALDAEMQAASNGAPLPAGFPDDAARLAQLMRQDPGIQLAFLALGGWDTHAGQGTATGQLANRLSPLGQGLAAFAQRLGPVLDDTVVVVMSEFGRTVRQNGNGGTDHGHGNAMWLLGGPVAGGRVHGRWPGLDDGALHEGRDLAVTTDFRQVLSDIASRHLGLPDARLVDLFPGWRPATDAPRVIARS